MHETKGENSDSHTIWFYHIRILDLVQFLVKISDSSSCLHKTHEMGEEMNSLLIWPEKRLMPDHLPH